MSKHRTSIITPLVIACALFMEQLDGSIIATALPTISRSLHTDPLHLNLAITSYMFSLAIFIPLSGWVADRLGARAIFRAAIVVFMLGSVACGFSDSLLTLVLSRSLQGLGGAMMVPVGRLVLLRSIPRSQLVDAMAWVTAPALIGPVMGPPLGGFIVTYASWRWIFFVNIPIGLLGLVMATIFIDDIKGRSREPLDKLGFGFMALSLAGLVFGFETVGRHLLPTEAVVACITSGVICFALYLWHVRHVDHPIVDLSLLKYPTYRASILGGSLTRIGIGALPFLLPLMLQYGFGLTPAASGFITFASAAGSILMKICATPIIRALGFRPILVFDALINTVFLAGCALFVPETPHSVIFIFLLLGGFFRSLQFTALNTIAFAEIPQALISRANTFYNMMQQLTLSLGVATGALMLNLSLGWHHETFLTAHDFWPAYLGVGIMSLLSALSFIPLPKHAGAELSGHAQPVHAVPAKESELKDPI
ncbi:MAG TPA: DHA2 family efflux MFS transporter permease subunit [Alphaproteobacteria bacterium]|nr:DHA2 family efflux MFS transporter permease subunit [Alphaproteobacteria bacterium]